MVPTKTKLQLSAALSLAALGLSACGGGATPSVPPSASLQQVAGSSTGRIVLTRLGAQRIGVQTEPVRGVPPPASPPVPKATRITATGATRVVARPPAPAPAPAAGGPTVVIPYSAVIYAPDGSTYAFTSPTPLVFTEVPITIDHIDGDSAYLTKGPKAGTPVVTVGAEELFGVQTGVLPQT